MKKKSNWTPPEIIDLDFYKSQYKVPDVGESKTSEQNEVLTKWIRQVEDQIDVLCGGRVYDEFGDLDPENIEDSKRIYWLQKACCDLLEYYIDTSKIFVDKNFSTTSNIPANINGSATDANFEMKRYDIIKKLQQGGWYQTLNTYNNVDCEEFEPKKINDWYSQLVEKLTEIFKRKDDQNDFAGYKLQRCGDIIADKKAITKLDGFKLENCVLEQIKIGKYIKEITIDEDNLITIIYADEQGEEHTLTIQLIKDDEKQEWDDHVEDDEIHVTTKDKETWNAKQEKLESTKNIKTIAGQSLLGEGDIPLPITFNDIYPVGSIYQSIDPDFDPNTTFGGTWERVESGRFLEATQSAADIGTTKGAGLPNISGIFNAAAYNEEVETGPFSGTNIENITLGTSGNSRIRQITMDLSKANSIYGKSTTVQPKSLLVYIWYRTA